jgi:hypothetical protein
MAWQIDPTKYARRRKFLHVAVTYKGRYRLIDCPPEHASFDFLVGVRFV